VAPATPAPEAPKAEEKPFELKPVEAPTAPGRSVFDPASDA
jgi:hypothetical protein